jgi:hypothetical protein
LPVHEREKFEERARERIREQDTQMPYEPPPRIVNGGLPVNGYYPPIPSIF